MYWTALAITSLIGALVQTGITYPHYAAVRGWPTGSWAGGDGWYIYHGIAAISVLFAAWKYGGIAGLAVVIVSSFFLAFGLVSTLRSWSQVISLGSLPAALVWHYMIP